MTLRKFFTALGNQDCPIHIQSEGSMIMGAIRGYAFDLAYDLSDWVLDAKVASYRPSVLNFYGQKELGFQIVLAR